MQNQNSVRDTQYQKEPKSNPIRSFQMQTQILWVSSTVKRGLGGAEITIIIRIDLRKMKGH